jgi:hypothetical protein
VDAAGNSYNWVNTPLYLYHDTTSDPEPPEGPGQ